MRISITITLLVTLCLSALGQRAEIRGSVLSKDSLKPIKNLDVVLFEDSKIKYGHTTDSNGVFEINLEEVSSHLEDYRRPFYPFHLKA